MDAARRFDRRQEGLEEAVERLLGFPNVRDKVAGSSPRGDVESAPDGVSMTAGLKLGDDLVVLSQLVLSGIGDKENGHAVFQLRTLPAHRAVPAAL